MVSSVFSGRSIFYLIYAVVLTAVLLYVRFPTDKFKLFCEKRFEDLLPGSSCRINKIKYQFPKAVSFTDVTISKKTGGESSDFLVDRFSVSPELPKFWRMVQVDGELYSGLFEAELDLGAKDNSFQLSDILLKGLNATALAEGLGIVDREVSGNVEFSGSYQAKKDQPAGGSGKGTLQVSAGHIDLLKPILALSSIEFETIAAEVTSEKGILRFVEGEILGKDLKGDFSGDLRLGSPLINSNLLLSGHLALQDEFLKNHPKERKTARLLMQRYKMQVLPFKVGGTIKRPLFRFSS